MLDKVNTERFYLNQPQLPGLPIPHDCMIKSALIEDNCLVFTFEDDISGYDSIRCYKPEAKSLIIRYHLAYDKADIRIFKRQAAHGLFRRRESYKTLEFREFSKLTERMEYLTHYLAYCSLIIELCAYDNILLRADVDHIEYEWIL